MGGVMSITGHPGDPPTRPGLSLGDIAGGLFTAIGVLAALQERERSGEGQLVDVSMLDCQVAILENAFMRYFATGNAPGPIGTRHPSATPFQAFPTKDGYLVLALWGGAENQWEMLCALLGTPELIYDERFATNADRTENHAELEPLMFEAMKKRSTDEWLREFDAIGIPCGPLNTIPEAAEHPQVRAREMLVEVEHPVAGKLPLANTPVKLSRTPGGIKGPAPAIGQHTDEVLRDLLSASDGEIARLRDSGVLL
jgi:CoA:oxalate CoA-transferase